MESESVLTKQQRIAENARRLPQVSFTSLAYHMDVSWLKEAWRRTRKDGAVGVDNRSAEQYAENNGSYGLTTLRKRHVQIEESGGSPTAALEKSPKPSTDTTAARSKGEQ